MKEEFHIIGYSRYGQGKDFFYSYNSLMQRNNDYFFHKATTLGINNASTAAMYRFTCPLCYQNMPQSLLSPALQNTLSVYQLNNGEQTKKEII